MSKLLQILAKARQGPLSDEDRALLLKVHKGFSVGKAKDVMRVLEVLGLDASPVKDGRKLVGYDLQIPGLGVLELRKSRGRIRFDPNDILRPKAVGFSMVHEARPEDFYSLSRDEQRAWEAAAAVPYEKADEIIRSMVAQRLGLEARDPEAERGLPQRSRDLRTDLSIRTCPVCFRDIKASEHTRGRMADHGFTIEGGGWGGYRHGSCPGTGALPWEKSTEATQALIEDLLRYQDGLQRRLERLRSGGVAELSYEQRRPRRVVKIKPGDPAWDRVLRAQIGKVESELRNLWRKSYPGIPWLRAAVRTWKGPYSDERPAVGAPLIRDYTPADLAGSPVEQG